eukprot:12646755-Ditylum_brightwellii.AAC.2
MVDMFLNALLPTNTRTVNTPVTVYDINGVSKTNTIGTLIRYGDVWSDRNGIAIILFLLKVKHKFQVTYDSAKSDAFEVHKTNKRWLFHEYKNGLHYHYTSNRSIVKLGQEEMDTEKDVILLNNGIKTVAGHKDKFSMKQVKMAAKARKLYGMEGFPSN